MDITQLLHEDSRCDSFSCLRCQYERDDRAPWIDFDTWVIELERMEA